MRSEKVNKPKGRLARVLALLRFELRVGLVDNIDAAFTANELAILVAGLERLERSRNFHFLHLVFGSNKI